MSASTLDRVSLTLLGWTITEPLIALCEWSEAHGDAVGAARARYRYNESTRAPGESAAA